MRILPKLKIAIRGHVNRTRGSRMLGTGRDADHLFDNPRFGSVMPGGYAGASFDVADSEVSQFPNAYVKHAQVRILIDEGPRKGTVVYEGMLREPARGPGGIVTLEAMGYYVLLQQRHDPMLWQAGDVSEDWVEGDSPPFSFNNSDSIDLKLGRGMVHWLVPKSAQVKGGAPAGTSSPADRSRLGIIAHGHRLLRIAGTLNQNRDMPGGGNPRFKMRLEKYDTASQSSTDAEIVEADLSSALQTAGANAISRVIGKPKPILVLCFWAHRDSPANGMVHPFRVWIGDLRVNGDAYRATPGNWDSYAGDEMIRDIAARVGFKTGQVTGTFSDASQLFSLLPKWWHHGSLWDLCEDIARHYRFKVAVWELGTGFEFGHWNTSWTNTWHVSGFAGGFGQGLQFHEADGAYSHIHVYWRHTHSRRRHVTVLPVQPNPFGGLPGPRRERHYRLHLHERQPNEIFPLAVANRLAIEFANPSPSLTVGPLAYVLDGSNRAHPAYVVRAGDKLVIDDYPGGAVTGRIYQADHDRQGTTLSGRRKPMNVHSIIRSMRRKDKREGHAG